MPEILFCPSNQTFPTIKIKIIYFTQEGLRLSCRMREKGLILAVAFLSFII